LAYLHITILLYRLFCNMGSHKYWECHVVKWAALFINLKSVYARRWIV